ncbi:unnamed protein product [Leuciscus chuanchicus]
MKGGRGHVWVERRDSPAAETDATLVRLHFPPPNTTEHANLESLLLKPLQQGSVPTAAKREKKRHVRKREKESESETCEMKKEQCDIWLSVALLAVADVIRRDYRNTILTQITSPPLRLTAVSLSASRVGHPAVISTAGTPRDFSVYFLSVNHLYSSHSSPGVIVQYVEQSPSPAPVSCPALQYFLLVLNYSDTPAGIKLRLHTPCWRTKSPPSLCPVTATY